MKCHICGADFLPTGRNSKFCPSCKELGRKNTQKRWYESHPNYRKQYWRDNKERLKRLCKTERYREAKTRRTVLYVRKLRERVIEALGGKCTKCGFSDHRCLQIDHIIPCGTRGRVSNVTLLLRILKAIKHGESHNYQLLCANCNAIKRVENNEVKNGKWSH